jgi:paraquat-inducible protein B
MEKIMDQVVLCASSAYEKKFWLNDDFKALPEQIKQELKIMCVLFTEDVGGVLSLEFEEDGTLVMKVDSDESDYLYDEIGSVLKIKQIQRDKAELMEALELFYKVFFLGADPNALLDEEG